MFRRKSIAILKELRSAFAGWAVTRLVDRCPTCYFSVTKCAILSSVTAVITHRLRQELTPVIGVVGQRKTSADAMEREVGDSLFFLKRTGFVSLCIFATLLSWCGWLGRRPVLFRKCLKKLLQEGECFRWQHRLAWPPMLGQPATPD